MNTKAQITLEILKAIIAKEGVGDLKTDPSTFRECMKQDIERAEQYAIQFMERFVD
jgi:hypothetical protein